MAAIISIRDLGKRYAAGFEALKSVALDIEKGEIFALLGPNGAGKTTLISIVCGVVTGPQVGGAIPRAVLVKVGLRAPIGPSSGEV